MAETDYKVLEAAQTDLEPPPLDTLPKLVLRKCSDTRTAVITFLVTAMVVTLLAMLVILPPKTAGATTGASSIAPGTEIIAQNLSVSLNSWTTCKTLQPYDYSRCGGDWKMQPGGQCCTPKYNKCRTVPSYDEQYCKGSDDWGQWKFIGGNQCCYSSDYQISETCKTVASYNKPYCTGKWKYMGSGSDNCCSHAYYYEQCRDMADYDKQYCKGGDQWGDFQYFGSQCCYSSQYKIHEQCKTVASYNENYCTGDWKYMGHGANNCCTYANKYGNCMTIEDYNSKYCTGTDDYNGEYQFLGSGTCCYSNAKYEPQQKCKTIATYESQYCNGDWKYFGSGKCCTEFAQYT